MRKAIIHTGTRWGPVAGEDHRQPPARPERWADDEPTAVPERGASCVGLERTGGGTIQTGRTGVLRTTAPDRSITLWGEIAGPRPRQINSADRLAASTGAAL